VSCVDACALRADLAKQLHLLASVCKTKLLLVFVEFCLQTAPCPFVELLGHVNAARDCGRTLGPLVGGALAGVLLRVIG
jgi:hypothetical protein